MELLLCIMALTPPEVIKKNMDRELDEKVKKLWKEVRDKEKNKQKPP